MMAPTDKAPWELTEDELGDLFPIDDTGEQIARELLA